METLKALEARRSVRSYLPADIEQSKLEEIIKAGQHAPNAGPLQMTVVKNKAILKQISEDALAAMKTSGVELLMKRASIPTYSPLYAAPVLIVVSAPPDLYARDNAACAATCMTIAATDLGIGSCYVMTPTLALDGENKLSAKVGIKSGYVPICGVILGYPVASSFPGSPRANFPVNYVK